MEMPNKKDVGQRVVYRPLQTDCLGEYGEITSVSRTYVWVRFDGNLAPIACIPETLEFA